MNFPPSLASAAEKYKKPLIIGVFNWAPYVGEELLNYGFATDVIRTALNDSGYETAIVYVPWGRLLKGIETGQYDILPGVWYTSERESSIFYGDAVAENRQVVINHAFYDFDYTQLEDLRDEIVGIGIGYGYPDAFLQADYFIREEAVDVEANLRKLIYRRLNLIVADEMVARYTAAQNFGDAADLIEYGTTPIYETPLLFGISRKVEDHQAITKAFNRTLAEMREDGRYQAILNSHHLGNELTH